MNILPFIVFLASGYLFLYYGIKSYKTVYMEKYREYIRNPEKFINWCDKNEDVISREEKMVALYGVISMVIMIISFIMIFI